MCAAVTGAGTCRVHSLKMHCRCCKCQPPLLDSCMDACSRCKLSERWLVTLPDLSTLGHGLVPQLNTMWELYQWILQLYDGSFACDVLEWWQCLQQFSNFSRRALTLAGHWPNRRVRIEEPNLLALPLFCPLRTIAAAVAATQQGAGQVQQAPRRSRCGCRATGEVKVHASAGNHVCNTMLHQANTCPPTSTQNAAIGPAAVAKLTPPWTISCTGHVRR
mgnify:CR=1 FL=1